MIRIMQSSIFILPMRFRAPLMRQLGGPGCMGILFASDDALETPLTRAHGTAFIRKPFRADDLLDALMIVIEICDNGLSLLSLPPGFRLLGLPGA